ncbi:type IV toxin-antitoxin system AbiEi family antitoxin domain-containing protein [Corallococcus macrosporus]|uniref:type IV toxin-antitoxin system AbiEi family antitoxin domain-containing protein n=1 Tax=Corallococcus macrosporus TaxID=35 RepID=UPI000682CE54|nr:type IV toxin-antitoxin system AbiEi family antitoxin domain-containing protein [Corallococcus macrosporus]
MSRRPGYKSRPAVATLVESLGLLRSRDLEAHGAPRSQLNLMCKVGMLSEVAPGVWARSNAMVTAAAIAAKRVPRGVLCLKSALWVHGMLPEAPAEVWMAIGEHARKPQWSEPPLRVVRFSGRAQSEGIEQRKLWGMPITVYGVAKTVADLFKYRNKLGFPIAVRAIHDALLSGRTTADEVRRFAETCRVTRSVSPYLDVLEARRGHDILRARQAFLAREDARKRRLEAPALHQVAGDPDSEWPLFGHGW